MLKDNEIAVLIDHALKVRECAHAPYSQYKVGAAVVDEAGRVFFGANVENSSYGLSLCAERAAIASAITNGAEKLTSIILVTHDDPPATPCGACRQWLAEFGDDSLEIIAANTDRKFQRYTLRSLLPNAFRLKAQDK